MTDERESIENELPDPPTSRTADTERLGAVWTPPVGRERSADGRPVFVYNRTRYVEIPLDAEDLHRYLAELRLEMDASSFRALIERNRRHISAVVLWRLGLDSEPAPASGGAARDATRRMREKLQRVFQVA